MRGFLGGVSVGAVVAVIGAAVWSLSVPLPSGVEIPNREPDPILAPREAAALPQDTPAPDADLVELAPSSPEQSPAAPDTVAEIDTDTADRPEVSTSIVDTPSEPAAEGAAPSSTLTSTAADAETPRAPAAGVAATGPTLPAQEQDPAPETDSAAAPGPAAVPEPALSAPEPETDAPDLADLTTEGQPSDQPPARRSQVPTVAAPELGAAPETTLPPSVTSPASAPETAQAEGAENEPPQPIPGGALRIADLPQATSDPAGDRGPGVGTRVVPLTERDAQPEAAAEAEADTLSPFQRNSEPVAPAPGLPLMSIILIEEEGAVGAEALQEFPYPLTFAIDPNDPRAAERMAARRAAGFEVLILTDLPRAGTAQDAETALPVWFERLPQAMGLLEGVHTGIQGNRALADQVAAIAAAAGYGMVLQDNGLNTVQKMALRDGVPAGVVFRDFDGAGQDPRAMRRFLDQAAFRAGQEGAVIMLGRLQPETISALLVWGLQDRASRVALVPASASLRRLREPLEQ